MKWFGRYWLSLRLAPFWRRNLVLLAVGAEAGTHSTTEAPERVSRKLEESKWLVTLPESATDFEEDSLRKPHFGVGVGKFSIQ